MRTELTTLYTELDTETRVFVRQKADEIRSHMRRTAQELWEAGEKLAQVQDALAHYGTGTFTAWIENELGLSTSMAYRLLNVYHNIDFPKLGKTNIGPSALYLLAAPSTPEPARQEALARAQDGETITVSAARAIIQEHTTEPEPEPEPEPITQSPNQPIPQSTNPPTPQSPWPTPPEPRDPEDQLERLRTLMPGQTDYTLRRHVEGTTIVSLALDEFQARLLHTALLDADTTPETHDAVQDMIAQLERALQLPF